MVSILISLFPIIICPPQSLDSQLENYKISNLPRLPHPVSVVPLLFLWLSLGAHYPDYICEQMEVIFYVVLGAAVDYSKGERRAGDYFVTRLSEHEWRRRGVEGRKREWGIGQRCSGEWMRAGGHIGDCKVGVEILPMSLDQVRLIFRIRLISNSLYELVIQNELSFVAPFSLRSR